MTRKRHRIVVNNDRGTYQAEGHMVSCHTDKDRWGNWIGWVECTCIDSEVVLDKRGRQILVPKLFEGRQVYWRRAVPMMKSQDAIEAMTGRVAVEHLAKMGYTPSMYGARWADR